MDKWLLEKAKSTGNHAILDGYCKGENVLKNAYTPVCSISGGSDSDIMLDIIYNLDKQKKVTYCWIDTGLEYQATKEHLKYLEEKYGIEIVKIKPKKPIPSCVKEYGVPFISKRVSDIMGRLQAHNFQWEDEPYEVLKERYPNCISGLKWWCNYYMRYDNTRYGKQFTVSYNKWLKEFILQNHPDFKISSKCCDVSKKKPADEYDKMNDTDLKIIGVRKSEGGNRSVAYTSCFSKETCHDWMSYRPLFWYTNEDKKVYEQEFGIVHSRCYTEYGMKRTGCVGCPFGRKITEEIDIIKQYEPNLYKAVMHIFGKSYEYTRKYREFAKMMSEREKAMKKGQYSLYDEIEEVERDETNAETEKA